MGIMGTGYCLLIVAMDDGRWILGKAELSEEGTKPYDLACTMCARYVLGFTGGEGDDALLF